MRHFLIGSVGILSVAIAANACSASDFDKIGKQFFQKAAKNFIAPTPKRPAPRPAQAGMQTHSYVAETNDGWKLVAVRYRDPQVWDHRRMPVILCHGFSYNGYFYDLRPDVSLAGYLAANGFDVWVVNLRGSGKSSKWALGAQGGAQALLGRAFAGNSGKVPAGGFVSLDPKYYKWNFDDHVDRDIPALVGLVKRETQAPQVAWLGHSMGGNIMLAYMSKYGQDASVGRLVTVGSQVIMPEGQLVTQFLLECLRNREIQVSGGNPSAEAMMQSMNAIFFNQHNTDPEIMQALLTYGHDMPSVGLVKQYMVLSMTSNLQDSRKSFSYAAGVNRIACPYLIVGGASDQIAPPRVQRHLYDSVASTDKTLLVLGRQSGLSVDYGHSDSLVGRRSKAEVYPLLARWLAGHPIGAPRR